MFACTHAYIQYVFRAPGGQKRMAIPLDLELQTVMSFHVDARNQTNLCPLQKPLADTFPKLWKGLSHCNNVSLTSLSTVVHGSANV